MLKILKNRFLIVSNSLESGRANGVARINGVARANGVVRADGVAHANGVAS